MLRPSRVLWCLTVILVGWSLLSGLYGMLHMARLAHASDVHRDDVGFALNSLEADRAIDYDKASTAMGGVAYSGTTPAERKTFEEDVSTKVFFHLTDAVVERVEDDWARTMAVSWINALVCGLVGFAVGVQAWRVREQE